MSKARVGGNNMSVTQHARIACDVIYLRRQGCARAPLAGFLIVSELLRHYSLSFVIVLNNNY